MKFMHRGWRSKTMLILSLWLCGCAALPFAGETDPVVVQLQEAIKRDPSDPQKRIELSERYFAKYQTQGEKDYLDRAATEAREAVRLKPGNAFGHLVLSRTLAVQAAESGDNQLRKEAVEEYEKALRINPLIAEDRDVAPPHIFGAATYLAKSEKDEKFIDDAIGELKEAIRLKPDYAPAHALLGQVYYFVKKEKELGLFELKEAVRLNPDDAGTHKLLGRIYHKRVHSVEDDWADEGAIDLGIREFKQVIRLTPEDPQAHGHLGRLYGHKGLYDLQVFEAKEALRLDPSVKHHYELGSAFLFNGQYERSVHEYRLTLRDKPDFARAHGDMASAYFLQNRMTDAIKKFEEYFEMVDPPHPIHTIIWQHLALKHARNDREANNLLDRHESNMGWQTDLVRYHQGELVESELLSRAAHKGEQCEAYFYIGYRYFLKGDKEKARGYFQATMDTKVFSYYEYIAARTRLEQLSGY